LFDGVEEGGDVGFLAAEEPDREFAGAVGVFVVLPRERTLDALAVDGDVVGPFLDGRDDRELDFGVGGLVTYVQPVGPSRTTTSRGVIG
jgi:hypothetical protein